MEILKETTEREKSIVFLVFLSYFFFFSNVIHCFPFLLVAFFINCRPHFTHLRLFHSFFNVTRVSFFVFSLLAKEHPFISLLSFFVTLLIATVASSFLVRLTLPELYQLKIMAFV